MQMIARGVVYTAAAALLGGLASLDYATAENAQPRSEQWSQGIIIKATPDRAKGRCSDKLANTLYRAGFRGESLRFAWAVAMRESRGIPQDESSPYFTGAYGIFQVQEEAWSDRSWWSRGAMMDPLQQAVIVFRYMTNRGADWSHWGLNANGTVNDTYYSHWTPWQKRNWISKPFQRFYRVFPCAG